MKNEQISDENFGQFRGRLISPQAVGKELGVSEFTIHRWIRDGKIRAVKLSSRCTRVDGNSLAGFLMERTFAPCQKGNDIPESGGGE